MYWREEYVDVYVEERGRGKNAYREEASVYLYERRQKRTKKRKKNIGPKVSSW